MKSLVRLIIEFEFDGGPPSNKEGELEFFLNGSSWCIGNVLEQLEKINDGCLCGVAKFEVLDKLTPVGEGSVESNWLSRDGGSISVIVAHRPKRKDILVRIQQGSRFAEVAMDYMHAETIANCIHGILEHEMRKVRL